MARLGPPARLPATRPHARGRAAGGGRRRGPARDRAGPGRPRPGAGQDAPAAAKGGDRRPGGRARRDRAPARPGRGGAERQGAGVRLRAGRAGPSPDEAQLPGARSAVREPMPKAAAAIEALDPDHVAEAVAGERRIGINVDGKEHELGPDDVTLVMQPLDGYQVEAEAGRAVALELELDGDLRREGLAREVVHAIQNARREAGLEVSDRICSSSRRRRRPARCRARPRGVRGRRDPGDRDLLRGHRGRHRDHRGRQAAPDRY